MPKYYLQKLAFLHFDNCTEAYFWFQKLEIKQMDYLPKVKIEETLLFCCKWHIIRKFFCTISHSLFPRKKLNIEQECRNIIFEVRYCKSTAITKYQFPSLDQIYIFALLFSPGLCMRFAHLHFPVNLHCCFVFLADSNAGLNLWPESGFVASGHSFCLFPCSYLFFGDRNNFTFHIKSLLSFRKYTPSMTHNFPLDKNRDGCWAIISSLHATSVTSVLSLDSPRKHQEILTPILAFFPQELLPHFASFFF